MIRFAAMLVLTVIVAACGGGPVPADLIVTGGAIVTLDPARPEVEAVAARDGRLVAVGSDEEVARFLGPDTTVLDLAGAAAVPGLIDAHGHFLGLGDSELQLDLAAASSWPEVVEMVGRAAEAQEPGTWIRGRGWHQDKWREPAAELVRGLPTRTDLDRVAPEHPVYLNHASGHAAVVNSLALELAGIDDRTPDPEGGEIVRDADGRASGALVETADLAVVALLPDDQSPEEVRRRARLAGRACLANGLTSFQDAGVTLAELETLRDMADAGELDVRLWMMLGEPAEDLAPHLADAKVVGAGGGFLSVAGIKRYMDGALGSRGAWLLEPYADQPDRSGARIDGDEELRETARLAAEHGFQLCIHAIGDLANREVLDLYEDFAADAERLRWRVEHAQNLHPDDVPRFAELGVIASMQPTHCTSDGPWVPDRLGPGRAEERAYVWRDLLEAGAVIAAGTDTPVESVDPIATFAAAVTRRMADGEAFFPAQVMTREEALRAMTLDAAYAAFEEADKGSLEVGKLADITVLSEHPFTIDDDRVADLEVRFTIVGGEVRYRAEP